MVAAIEQLIQTATRLLEGRLTAREAITILATLTPEAEPQARQLRASDPDRAETFHELIAVLCQELRARQESCDLPRHMRAVIDDLAKVEAALAG